MDNGIATIIASGLAGLVSLIVFIGSNVFIRINTAKPYKIEIYERQLFKVFTPLEILLEKGGPYITPELLKKIEEIIYANLTLIPNKLSQEYKNLTKPIHNKKHTTFVLHDIVSTYYNIRKKELGYPFDHKAINIWCLDSDERLSTLMKSFKNPTFLALVIYAVVFAISALRVIIDEEWSPMITGILLGIGFLVFLFWSFYFPSFKIQGLQYKKAYEISTKNSSKRQNITQRNQPVIIKPTANLNCNNVNEKRKHH